MKNNKSNNFGRLVSMNNNFDVDDLNKLDNRIKNFLISIIRYPTWIEKIIKVENLPPIPKETQSITEFEKYFLSLRDDIKERLLNNWEEGIGPVLNLAWLPDQIEFSDFENVLNYKILQDRFQIIFLRKTNIGKVMKYVFLKWEPLRYFLINGKLQQQQPSRYISVVIRNNSNIIEIRTSKNIGEFKNYILNELNYNPNQCRFNLEKTQLLQFAKQCCGHNAKISCEGELIHERGFATKNTDLFSIYEFKKAIEKLNYNLIKMFVTVNIEEYKPPLNEVSIRIFPQEGKLTFTGHVNEKQIERIVSKIESIKRNISIKPYSKFPLEKFLSKN